MLFRSPEAKDGIAWIIPPHDASELAIERVVRATKNDGAHAIRLMPRASSAAVVPAQQHAGDADDHPSQTAREMVMEMAGEANSTNVTALKKRSPGRGVTKLRRLLELQRSYPAGPFLEAVGQALKYGLFDLARLERLILERVAGDFFNLGEED